MIWDDAATGLCCVAVRHPLFGTWCGYVCVPEGHPLHGKHPRKVRVIVHGGMNYTGPACQQTRVEKPGHWWFGFDCAHGGDLVPSTKALALLFDLPDETAALLRRMEAHEVYRTLGYVREQCIKLAGQLDAITTRLKSAPPK